LESDTIKLLQKLSLMREGDGQTGSTSGTIRKIESWNWWIWWWSHETISSVAQTPSAQIYFLTG
jgi:hypothetical protein